MSKPRAVDTPPPAPPAISRMAVVEINRPTWTILVNFLGLEKTDNFELARRRFGLARALNADDFGDEWRKPMSQDPAQNAVDREQTREVQLSSDELKCLEECCEAGIKKYPGVDQFYLFRLFDRVHALIVGA